MQFIVFSCLEQFVIPIFLFHSTTGSLSHCFVSFTMHCILLFALSQIKQELGGIKEMCNNLHSAVGNQLLQHLVAQVQRDPDAARLLGENLFFAGKIESDLSVFHSLVFIIIYALKICVSFGAPPPMLCD